MRHPFGRRDGRIQLASRASFTRVLTTGFIGPQAAVASPEKSWSEFV
jgi:hypothetical protein